MVVELSKRSSAEKFIDEINITNSKKVAVVFVLGFIAYHGILHLQYGPDSCSWLLSDGRYKGDHEWQPYGCMLHRYSQTDTRHCFRYLAFWGRYNHFAFIGDSRVQQLYHSFVAHIKVQQEAELPSAAPNSNFTFVDSKLRLSAQFIWSPYVSSKMVQQFRDWERSPTPPSVVVAGCGPTIIWEQNASLAALAQYRSNLSRLVQPARGLAARGAATLWVLQEPVDTERLPPLTQQQLDLYNDAATEMLSHSSVKLWGSSALVVGGAMSEDGLTLSSTALRHDTQILLNMYCNDHMNFDDGTCCSSPEPYTTLQIVTFSIFLVCMVLAAALAAHTRLQNWRRGRDYRQLGQTQAGQVGQGQESGDAARQALTALATLGLILAYFYLCDRTNFFMKENKYYSEWSFWLPVGYVLVLGLFFTEEARSPRVLHREQTAEWRGWMQLLVLGAQVTGAARLLPHHMLLRALASAYLFLSGYGHFCYVWHTGDAGLVRLLRVLFRLNFMTVALCLTMNRPYQFYQFVPLLSFWLVLLYSVLALPPLVSALTSEGHPYRYGYLALKFLGLFAVITVLYMSEVFFEKVFVTRPWKALFVTTDDDIQQWWQRWKSDRYSLWAGAVFAACFRLSQRHQLLDDSSHANLLAPRAAVAAALAALALLAGWLALPLLCGGRRPCEEVHGYIGALPALAYVVLRNLSGALRSRYSSFLAWFGDISLELFVCQHHIWLAADTHGVLVLVPGMPNLNLLLTSFIFVCAAHEVRRLTQVLQPLVVPNDVRKCLRNLVLFIVILVPIGIHDGMF